MESLILVSGFRSGMRHDPESDERQLDAQRFGFRDDSERDDESRI